MHTYSHGEHPWLWPAVAPTPLKVGAFPSDATHLLVYRNRRITVRASGVPEFAFRAYVDGWPVSNLRRGAPGGFPAIDQAVGRCKAVIDMEAPARRWLTARRLLGRIRSIFAQAMFGDRRGAPVGSSFATRSAKTVPVTNPPLILRSPRPGLG